MNTRREARRITRTCDIVSDARIRVAHAVSVASTRTVPRQFSALRSSAHSRSELSATAHSTSSLYASARVFLPVRWLHFISFVRTALAQNDAFPNASSRPHLAVQRTGAHTTQRS